MRINNNKPYIVAEIGVNHNGSLLEAKKLVDAAKEIGIDAVKFQVFSAKHLLHESAKKAEYQVEFDGDDNQYDMLSKLELSHTNFIELFNYCEIVGIDFFSSAFDLISINFLSSLGQKTWKIPSGEIDNLPLLNRIHSVSEKVIISTGMASIDEIKSCVEVFKDKKIVLLHCTSDYPTHPKDVNLNVIDALKENFPGITIGFSDHSEGVIAAQLAVVKGVYFFEKHFTLNREATGPDHKASLDPIQMKEYVDGIRFANDILGQKTKVLSIQEEKTKLVVRKSIYATKTIQPEELFTSDNLTTLRPAKGLSPMSWEELIGKPSSKRYDKGDLIDTNELQK